MHTTLNMPDKPSEEDKDGKSKGKTERTAYRNLFERVKQNERQKIKEELDKKEIKDYNEEEKEK
ncbi:MAG: hypothetical protein EVJ47_03640 [Candidatus Acidulodesulfobacterium ferriphilum]|jgi:hypothetical protein|uniref:Uncharacterized protein n=1 Tax=Candidatus Acidulodesulfobacterium ferriphilum TaxID=2597223 RepID=A0A519BDM3_9DELT|nr:MAG: hypothetical protein EVJ47_03640 [Candidatus Acidulodesulfobacterium ferriphilum]